MSLERVHVRNVVLLGSEIASCVDIMENLEKQVLQDT